jgi:hypothetical protein
MVPSAHPLCIAHALLPVVCLQPWPEISDSAELARQQAGRDVWHEIFGEKIW